MRQAWRLKPRTHVSGQGIERHEKCDRQGNADPEEQKWQAPPPHLVVAGERGTPAKLADLTSASEYPTVPLCARP